MAGKPKRNYLEIFIRGIARHPSVSQPDVGGQFSDGRYKTGVIPDAAELARVTKLLKDFGKKCFPGVDDVKLPIKKDKKDPAIVFLPTRAGVDKEKNARKPLVFDAKLKPMPKSANVGSGSDIRVKVSAADYVKTEKVKTSDDYIDETVHGITLYLNSVQVIKYVAARDGTAGFDVEEDGFDAAAADFGDESEGEGTETQGDAFDL